MTLNGSDTLINATNAKVGRRVYLHIIQDGTGSRTLEWGTQYLHPGGVEPTLTSAANACDIAEFICSTGDTLKLIGMTASVMNRSKPSARG